MKTTKANLLSVVMDGIRDANMLYDYAEQAKAEGDEPMCAWFEQKADERAASVKAEWHDAKKVLDLEAKDDDSSWCLKHHVDHELTMLAARK